MADNDEGKNKKKSRIASLDLKNYKAKYTDSYGLGKPNEIDLDNFLIAEPDKPEEKIFDEKKSVDEKIPDEKVEIKPIKNFVQDKPIEKIEKVIENKPSEVIEKKIVDVDKNFDDRVNAEAENNFYDEKPIQPNQTFHSNAIKKSNANELNEKPKRKLNLREPIKVNVKHEIKNKFNEEEEIIEEKKEPPRRTETYGVVISAVVLIYSIFTLDKPLIFFSVSLFLYLLRSIIAAPFGKYRQSIENAIKGFSIVVFFGAIFFIFF